jgi:uncharacterized protein with beta-barrel porin domain
VYLNLTAVLGSGGDPHTLSGPHQNVATSLNNFFNGGGALPANFVGVFGLTGSALTTALSQLNGEVATGAERSSFQLTNEFLSLMLDPFVNGRGYAGAGFGGPPSAMANCASGQPTSTSADMAIFRLSPPVAKDCGLRGVYEPRWSAWGSAFGNSGSANGSTSAGTNKITASTFGFAGGMDYHVTPNTLFGFALAGAGTNWGLANSLGSGRSDAFEAGAYGINWFGPAYVAGALSFTNNWFTTSRSALATRSTRVSRGKPTARAPKAAIASPCCRHSG